MTAFPKSGYKCEEMRPLRKLHFQKVTKATVRWNHRGST